jgi:hypothetical protein
VQTQKEMLPTCNLSQPPSMPGHSFFLHLSFLLLFCGLFVMNAWQLPSPTISQQHHFIVAIVGTECAIGCP